MKKKYSHKGKLLFTYTDFIRLKQMMCMKMFRKIKTVWFYWVSKNSKFYDEANKEVIGKMKDKTENVLIFGFVGLKPKMYSNIEEDDFRKKIQKKLIES